MQNSDTWQAGRELDAEIAKVMGWEVKRYTNGDLMTNIGGIRCYIPHYSTSWEGMGLMLEWLNKFSNTELRHFFGEGAEWTVLFTLHEPSLHWERLYFNGFAETAPLAVARAILAYAVQREGVKGGYETLPPMP